MSAMDQIREILDSNADIDAAELRLVVKNIMKARKVRTNAVQKSMQELVGNHQKVSLARLRKELKLAYAEVHKNDEEIDVEGPTSAYRKFVKEQNLLMKNEDMYKDAPQPLRMVEIGKRWQAHKLAANAASVELPANDGAGPSTSKQGKRNRNTQNTANKETAKKRPRK